MKPCKHCGEEWGEHRAADSRCPKLPYRDDSSEPDWEDTRFEERPGLSLVQGGGDDE